MKSLANNFSPSKLLHHIEMLVKNSFRETTNYSWLKSKHIKPEVVKYCKELHKLTPIVLKLTSENCAKIAVKLDNLTDSVYSADAILSTFRNLVQEHYSIQLMEDNIKNTKEKKTRINRVYPKLEFNSKKATVCYIMPIANVY